jgi:DNA polymerase III alpha subunit (gram-positive type)
MNKWLFLDNEMGSTEPDYSLLTSSFLVVDDNFNVVDSLDLFLKPNDGRYIVAAEGMSVNKIDLVEHDKIAITYKEGGTQLFNFLRKVTGDGKNKLNVVGKGIYGDIQFIEKYLISRGSFEKFTSYHIVELSSIVQFLKSCGLFPDEVSGSLVSLAKHFKIEVNENIIHSAQYDSELTFQVFLALRKMFIGTPI